MRRQREEVHEESGVADSEKRLYAEFGAEASPRALLNPQAWLPILRGVLRSLGRILRGRQPVTSLHSAGGKLGLPADLLIARDGRILACKYGEHIYDQWSVDDLLAHAGRVTEKKRKECDNIAPVNWGDECRKLNVSNG
jgi:hypothetical protein